MLKLKKIFRNLNINSKNEKKYTIEQMRSFHREYKNFNLALKHAKKVLKYIKKDAGGECGFWYDINRSYYAECCLARPNYGCVGHKNPECPLYIANQLITSLTKYN